MHMVGHGSQDVLTTRYYGTFTFSAAANALCRYMCKFAISHFYLKIRIMLAVPVIISITDMTQVCLIFGGFCWHLLGIISHKHCCSIVHLYHHAIRYRHLHVMLHIR